MAFFYNNIDVDNLSPLNLAYIGDCIYEMHVREMLVSEANRPVNDLHKESVKYVSAKAQGMAYNKIKDFLSDEETRIFKRGRNAKVGHNPKSSTVGEYHTSTGLEALFGYLYLTSQFDRIKELFEIINS